MNDSHYTISFDKWKYLFMFEAILVDFIDSRRRKIIILAVVAEWKE